MAVAYQYMYAECGLDNVIIEGLEPVRDDEGDLVYTIPNVAGLHRAIARAIVMHEKGMSGKELRFLRSEMGMTQAELAKAVHREPLTVGRWERGEIEIDSNAEALTRLLAVQRLGLQIEEDIEALSSRCVPTVESQPIVIIANDPEDYRQKAA